MAASLLQGIPLASIIHESLYSRVKQRKDKGLKPPGLAVILIGKDVASTIYVNNKRKACEEVGFHSYAYNLDESISEMQLLSLIDALNASDDVHGILVQLPLPKHICKKTVIERINPAKDVDGFHPYNIGRLAQGNPTLRPCTPFGIMQLLDHYQITLSGIQAVVVGASNIVGRPMALELLLAKATVTVCHSNSINLEQHIRSADLIIVATGHRGVIDCAWLHDKQIIVDVGIHRLEDGTLCGDVDFSKAQERVAWITPVPGGVGPMTIASLLQNTLQAATLLDQKTHY